MFFSKTLTFLDCKFLKIKNMKYKKEELLIALEESLKLQAHYAKILNEYDNGERIIFENTEEWVNRLKNINILK